MVLILFQKYFSFWKVDDSNIRIYEFLVSVLKYNEEDEMNITEHLIMAMFDELTNFIKIYNADNFYEKR